MLTTILAALFAFLPGDHARNRYADQVMTTLVDWWDADMSIRCSGADGVYGALPDVLATQPGEAQAKKGFRVWCKIHTAPSQTVFLLSTRDGGDGLNSSFNFRLFNNSGWRPSITRTTAGSSTHYSGGDTIPTMTIGVWYELWFYQDSDDGDNAVIGMRTEGGTWTLYNKTADSPGLGYPNDDTPPGLFNDYAPGVTVDSASVIIDGMALYLGTGADKDVTALNAAAHPLDDQTALYDYWACDAIENTDKLIGAVNGKIITLSSVVEITESADAPTGVPSMATLSPTLGKDTELSFAGADLNFGGKTTVRFGNNNTHAQRFRGLHHWGNLMTDYGADNIPAGATIDSAVLTWECTATTAVAANAVVVKPSTRPTWTEGTDDGTGTPDGATWNEFNYSGTSANPWTTAGGDTTATGQTTGLTTPTTTGSKTYDITATVQDAIDNQSGLLCYQIERVSDGSNGVTGVCTMSSTEGATPPSLLITYTEAAAGSGGGFSRGRGKRASVWDD